jgi:diguanylate cyclase (GGDEF)-like protein/PAS domain S-box-containing protein
VRLRRTTFRPFSRGGGRTIAAILVTFAAMFGLSVALSIIATRHSRGRGLVIEVAARQRTLAERYVESILLVRAGHRSDPPVIASLLKESAQALLDGGTAPSVNGDDDETTVPPAQGGALRAQLTQEQRLVGDLTRTGAALLSGRPTESVRLSAGETLDDGDPIDRLRALAALTSNVSLNAARTITRNDDRNVADLITMQAALGVGGLLASLLLAWGLIATMRRRSAHFRSLVQSSTDLVAVLGRGGCRYAGRSFTALLGRNESELLQHGFQQLVHEDDRAIVAAAQADGAPAELVFRMCTASGEWRHLEAGVTDLRHDRNVRGVMLNARDITERIELESELALKAERDKFASELVEALEMADEEDAAYDVTARAMTEISDQTPMELLLADSSRAHLRRVAASPTAGAPECPVQSPYACVAVRRGTPVVFESSESLNACPKLRGRSTGPCSAVCVPVGSMGRALGVLHMTAAEGAPPPSQVVEQLTTLATQAGSRIGTVRVFAKTQLQAGTDTLTGLPNRRSVQKLLRSLSRRGQQFTIAFADLDEFKLLNDKHGHELGDRALRLFAQVCQSVLRDEDVIGRWGGEEFLIVLPDIDRNRGVGVLERIQKRLAESHLAGHPRFTASFGITDSGEAGTIDGLVRIADAALYESKAAGRDTITIGVPMLELPTLPPGLDAGGAAGIAGDGIDELGELDGDGGDAEHAIDDGGGLEEVRSRESSRARAENA